MPSASTLAAGEAPGPQEKAPRRDGMDATRGNSALRRGARIPARPAINRNRHQVFLPSST